MSHYVYGYGTPYGYQTSQPYACSTNQTYPDTPFNAHDATEGRPVYGQGVAEAYDYNQTTIPGLGMGFSHNTANWQPALPNKFPDTQTDTNGTATRDDMTKSDGNRTSGNSISHHSRPEMPMDVDAIEEGELSEGELEDIYEPDEADAPSGLDRYGGQSSGSTTLQHHSLSSLQTNHEVKERTWNSKPSGRDRSGSYSPYLSPREIQSSGPHARAPRSANDPSATRPVVYTETAHDNGDNDNLTQPTEAKHADAIISESKKRAEEAILRLWPLNVRYHNYIEEGIDRTLLDELFKELGLDLEATVSNQEHSKASSRLQVAKAPSSMPNAGMFSTQSNTAIAEPKSTEQTKDKSEERKDRIARLLAAKGSKATVADTSETKPGAPAPVLPNNAKSEKTKAQSEKSKLIQQKMEALMKAREANAKAAPQAPIPEPQLPVPAPETSRSQSLAPVNSVNLDEQPGTAVENADPGAAPSIPGLFLTSNALSPAPYQRKRPVAADLNENSTATSQKRPFGQTRESRPFLIDVSDDEDDAEMEIDSPELRPSAIRRPTTPGSRTTSLRDHLALPDGASHHTISSPKTAGTPTTSANGMYDLESMNKKIEDMKRKIAEAEARKKAKPSANNSPLPQSESPSKEGSVDVLTPPAPALTRAASTIADASQSSPASTTPHHSSPHPITKLPKVRGQPLLVRPSLRARVASERLPILEARRREQVEKLKQLQSEVARTEKEIENSLIEEERLRRDAAQTESALSTQEESGIENVPSETNDHKPLQGPISNETLMEPEENDKTNISCDEAEQDASMDESSSTGSVDNQEMMREPHPYEPEVHEKSSAGEDIAPDGQSSLTHLSTAHDMGDTSGETAMDETEEPEEDVAMEEADTSSEEEDTDDYEPADVGISLPDPQSIFPPRSSPHQAPLDNAVLETSDTDLQGLAMTTPVTQPISTGDGDTEYESNGEVEIPKTSPVRESTEKTTFVPYETPLQYFRAYRFHPQYSNSVAGGLRSLTYSNKIDVAREVCPDQLIKGACPRGSECQFQHFETMQVPDDQILLQLGASGNCETEQQYVDGLRELLTDFRNRKVKDFEAISKGIIEYRAKFLGDRTKILPLGGVSL
ncbi:hypothetical protein F53441_727 [Fusarium austroafricanum]|uniref:C3H1-type domain-containing protein n=1 Tax=Fusarium austroafricanum TaxID=2364996 RepID=A0A8H4P319_9HYPO|nr:hypothetical protein F53441_727 [Fusarium austroafricanum]